MSCKNCGKAKVGLLLSYGAKTKAVAKFAMSSEKPKAGTRCIYCNGLITKKLRRVRDKWLDVVWCENCKVEY